jgi:hypothetical protein
MLPGPLDTALLATTDQGHAPGAAWWYFSRAPLHQDSDGNGLPEMAIAVVDIDFRRGVAHCSSMLWLRKPPNSRCSRCRGSRQNSRCSRCRGSCQTVAARATAERTHPQSCRPTLHTGWVQGRRCRTGVVRRGDDSTYGCRDGLRTPPGSITSRAPSAAAERSRRCSNGDSAHNGRHGRLRRGRDR